MESTGMMQLSKVAQVLGGELLGRDAEFAAVSTDSRAISAGDLFWRCTVTNLMAASTCRWRQKGAVAALVNAAVITVRRCRPIVLVGDTRLALGKLAGYWRDQFAIPLVGITGNGKTTVKEMLTAILREAAGSEEAVLATQEISTTISACR
jgi:UDP-N-acetylmuramoyl-tripeptide--D-alanyl-D-alanine ligase